MNQARAHEAISSGAGLLSWWIGERVDDLLGGFSR